MGNLIYPSQQLTFITIGFPNQGIEIVGRLIGTKRIALLLSSSVIYWIKPRRKAGGPRHGL